MAETAIRKYRGGAGEYTEIASRGKDEVIAINIQYDPGKIGTLYIRFIARSLSGKLGEFQHFLPRGHNHYEIIGAKESFYGLQLNKEALPLFQPAPYRNEIAAYFQKFDLPEIIADWIGEQLNAEGFAVNHPDLKGLVLESVSVPAVDPAAVKLLLEFPDLKLEKAKFNAKASLPKEGPYSDEEEDGGEEEEFDA